MKECAVLERLIQVKEEDRMKFGDQCVFKSVPIDSIHQKCPTEQLLRYASHLNVHSLLLNQSIFSEV